MGSYWLLGRRSWHAEQVARSVVISLVIQGHGLLGPPVRSHDPFMGHVELLEYVPAGRLGYHNSFAE